MNLIFGDTLFDKLLTEAANNPRLRFNLDLRDNTTDTSQRMLNALLPGTQVPVHRHLTTSESVVILKGRISEVYYDDNGTECDRIVLEAGSHNVGVQIEKGCWHTIEVHEPSVIIEFKNGAYVPLADNEVMNVCK